LYFIWHIPDLNNHVGKYLHVHLSPCYSININFSTSDAVDLSQPCNGLSNIMDLHKRTKFDSTVLSYCAICIVQIN
jgi:hypothetical protein